MGRKKKHPEHENHERWLVSYADFITLLFAFFVVMFASSQTDKAKAKAVSDSVREAMEHGGVPAAVREILGGTVDDKGKGNAMMKGPGGSQPKNPPPQPDTAAAELLPSMKLLTDELKQDIAAGKLQISMQPRGLVISLAQAAFFPSGNDAVDPGTTATLEKIATAVKNLPNSIRLEGHTDPIPIHTAKFPSNWELSAARAISMLSLFTERLGVPKERLAVAGYADTIPIASNDTPEGRSRNRRVDVVILNFKGLIDEPDKSEKKAPEQPASPAPAKAHHGG